MKKAIALAALLTIASYTCLKSKTEELNKDTRIFYEIYDSEWVSWLEKLFWNFFKSSIDYNTRLKEIERIF